MLADNRRHNEGKCTLQLDGCEGDANSVHHLLGKAAGDDRKYLVACCGHCNSKTGDPMKNEQPIRRISSW